jgi:hypothetical protein
LRNISAQDLIQEGVLTSNGDDSYIDPWQVDVSGCTPAE